MRSKYAVVTLSPRTSPGATRTWFPLMCVVPGLTSARFGFAVMADWIDAGVELAGLNTKPQPRPAETAEAWEINPNWLAMGLATLDVGWHKPVVELNETGTYVD